MGAIEITGLSHQYVDTDGLLITAIQDVSLSVRNGRFISIVGPSGCGKTTLLNIVGGFIGPVALLRHGSAEIKSLETRRGMPERPRLGRSADDMHE